MLSFRWLTPLAWLSLIVLALPSAADEARDFQVLIDGKSSGEHHLRITADGGKTVVQTSADVRARFGLFNYTYSFRGSEVWDGKQFERASGVCVDGGKRTEVEARNQADRCVVSVNGKSRTLAGCAWTTLQWQLPSGTSLASLDVDTGKRLQVTLQRVAVEKLMLDEERNCTRFHLAGDAQADLWFDDTGRLVRQVSVEDGHRVELRLVRLRR